MDEHLAPWEAYCRDYCFEVPDDLVLPGKVGDQELLKFAATLLQYSLAMMAPLYF